MPPTTFAHPSYRALNACIVTSLSVFVSGAALTGCATQPKKITNPVEAAKSIDWVAKQIEQYGVVSASPPILVAANPEDSASSFDFELKRGAVAYYDEARQDVQAKIALASDRSLDLELQATYGRDITQREAYEAQKEEHTYNQTNDRALREQRLAAAKREYDEQMALAAKNADPAAAAKAVSAATDKYSNALNDEKTSPGAEPTSATAGTGPKARDQIASARVEPGLTAPTPEAVFGLISKVSSAAPTIANRSAIITAAGDNTVEGIFRLLGDPAKSAEFSGRTAFFGVTMIAVTPGFKTRKKFVGDISVLSELQAREVPFSEITKLEAFDELPLRVLARIGCDSDSIGCRDIDLPSLVAYTGRKEASLLAEFSENEKTDRRIPATAPEDAFDLLPRTLKGGVINLVQHSADGIYSGSIGSMDCTTDKRGLNLRCRYQADFAPSVAAVSPMTESQVIDEGSSERDRLRLAADLAVAMSKAGDNRSARIFAEYARTLQKDAISRTPQNTVTGYSNGSMFGYQIGPSFAAVTDHNSSKAQSGDILQRQSFPALLLFGVRTEATTPQAYLIRLRAFDPNWREEALDNPENKKPLQMRVVVLRSFVSLRQTWRWSPLRRIFSPWFRIREQERAQWVEDLYDARKFNPGSGSADSYVQTRVDSLLTSVGATESLIPLPSHIARVPLDLKSVLPTQWRMDLDDKKQPKPTAVRLVLQGRGFKDRTLACALASKGTPIKDVTPDVFGDRVATCTFTVSPENVGAMIPKLTDKDSGAVAYGAPIEVIVPGT